MKPKKQLYKNWIIEKNATTTQEGLKYKECITCKTKLEKASIPVIPEEEPKVDNTTEN